MTVHESSLSPSIHAVLAAELGMEEKAVEMYQRSSALQIITIMMKKMAYTLPQ